MSEQLDLFEWIDDLNNDKSETLENMPEIANWSYGVVQLQNGDLFLAEIYWDADDQPLMYCEPHFTVDPEEGVPDLIKSLQNAVLDLTENSAAIPVSAFYTNVEND